MERVFVGEAVMITRSNEDVLASVIGEHARLVYRICHSVLRNHHDAEDAAQETFMRVLRRPQKLENVRDPKTWLARIAWRVAVERSKQRPEISLSQTETAAAFVELRSQLASAEESTLGEEMAELLASLIAALPASLRDALRLSTIEELSPAEIARVLKTGEASVRSRLFRARQILKEKLLALASNYGMQR
jgi:RNA polymerase sigma-70 factor, ECF subfamily